MNEAEVSVEWLPELESVANAMRFMGTVFGTTANVFAHIDSHGNGKWRIRYTRAYRRPNIRKQHRKDYHV